MAPHGRDSRVTHTWSGLGFVCLWSWLGLVLTFVFLPLPAAAQTVTGAARVTTFVDACVPIALDQFQRVLAIELGTSIEFAPGAAQEPDGTVIRVGCAQHAIELQLHDSVTRKAMQRSLELPDVDVATRTRLLALAVAEFVVASWMELQLSQPPPIEPVGPRATLEAAQEASRVAGARLPAARDSAPPSAARASAEPTRWLLGLSVEPLLFSGGSGLMGQGSVHVQQRPIQHLVLSLSLGIAHASWLVQAQGTPVLAKLTSTSGRIGVGYLGDLGDVELWAAVGARFGLVHFAGESLQLRVQAAEFYAPWGGPNVQLAAAYHWQHLRIGLELEVGYVTLAVQALERASTAQVVAQLSGVWGATSLFAAWLF